MLGVTFFIACGDDAMGIAGQAACFWAAPCVIAFTATGYGVAGIVADRYLYFILVNYGIGANFPTRVLDRSEDSVRRGFSANVLGVANVSMVSNML